jgi:hypothetical protein
MVVGDIPADIYFNRIFVETGLLYADIFKGNLLPEPYWIYRRVIYFYHKRQGKVCL